MSGERESHQHVNSGKEDKLTPLEKAFQKVVTYADNADSLQFQVFENSISKYKKVIKRLLE